MILISCFPAIVLLQVIFSFFSLMHPCAPFSGGGGGGAAPLKCFLIFIINIAITLPRVVGCLGLIGMIVGGAGDDLAVTLESHVRIQEKLKLCLHYRQPCMHGPILDTDPSLFSFLILFKYNFNSHQLSIGNTSKH